MGTCRATADLALADVFRGDLRGEFSDATRRIIAYWTDECARDLPRLLRNFTRNAEVITPDGRYHGHDAVAALYQKSFDSYPGLAVDVVASFPGRGGHCYEYKAVLSDMEKNDWLIEGINLMKLEGGLIASLRSFEDAPRRMTAGKPA